MDLCARSRFGEWLQRRGGYLIVVPFAIFQSWDGRISSVPSRFFIVSAVIAAVIWWLFAREMTAKTLNGSRIHTAVLGFQEFMNRVDAERLKTMPPNTFEKFLAICHGAGSRAPLGAGFRRDRERSADLVRRRRRLRYGMGFNPIFFSPVPCTAWRRICTRYSFPPRGQVLRDQDGAVVAASGAEEVFWRRIWRRRRRRVLSRLRRLKNLVRPERLELPTLCSEGRCSIQLSYGRIKEASQTRPSVASLSQGRLG